MELSPAQRAILTRFSPSAFSVQIKPDRDRSRLILLGLIEWVPPIWVSKAHEYSITEAGRAALKAKV